MVPKDTAPRQRTAAHVLREEAERCFIAARRLCHDERISTLFRELGNLMISLAQSFEDKGDAARAGPSDTDAPAAPNRRRNSDPSC